MASERNRKVGILGVPLGFGAGKTGSELGASAMRLSRVRGRTLAEHITHLGYDVTDHSDAQLVRPANPNEPGDPRHLAEFLTSSGMIMSTLESILTAGEFPVILG